MTDSPQPTTNAASNGCDANSPQSRRRGLSSPWASVVRGHQEQNSSPTAAAVPGSSLSPPPEQVSASDDSLIEISGSEAYPQSSDVTGDSNAGRSRRPAWNRPSNGVLEPASVMGGAVAWPALSETTRSVPRSSSDGPRPVSDGSNSLSQAPIIPQPSQGPANNNAHTSSVVNNSMPSRPRLRNRNGSATPQNIFNQQSLPMPPPFPVFEVPYGMVPPPPPVLDGLVRGSRSGGGSQSHTGSDHSHRNNSRRGGYGPHTRVDGSVHNNHGGRRNQDHRDAHHTPPHFVPPSMGYMPPPLPPGAAPFMAPAAMRAFAGLARFESPHPFIFVPPMPPDSFRAMVPPPPPPMLFSPANENTLTNLIVKQIDFYFSDDNLAKDNFLRTKMNEHGWVPISLIASFRRVQQLTQDIAMILESLRYSTVVEVQGENIRRRNDWRKWLLSAASRVVSESSSNTTAVPENDVATSLQEVSLDDNMSNSTVSREAHTEMGTGKKKLSSEKLTGQLALANVEENAEGVHPKGL